MLCSLERLQPLTKHPPAMGQAFDGPARPKFPKPQLSRWGFFVSDLPDILQWEEAVWQIITI